MEYFQKYNCRAQKNGHLAVINQECLINKIKKIISYSHFITNRYEKRI